MNKEKLKKVIAGEATSEEASEVITLTATDEGGIVMDSLIQDDIDQADENFARAWIDVDLTRLRTNFYHWLNVERNKRSRRFLIAAAIIPFIIMSAIALFFANQSGLFVNDEYVEVIAANGKHTQVVLADGTVVELNAGSKLRYPKHFALFHRDVNLSGEGYFTVAKDKMRPFKLITGDICINVTGTMFNVDAYEDQSVINILLDEGAISVITPKHQIEMKPAQYVSYNKETGDYSILSKDKNILPTAWRDNILNFHQTPLCEILKIISRERDIKFIIKDSTMLNSRFTFRSNNEYTDQILHDIEAVSNVRFIAKKGYRNTYVVSRK